jgi:hypothetical protein
VIKLLLLSTHDRRSGSGKEKNKQWVAVGIFLCSMGHRGWLKAGTALLFKLLVLQLCLIIPCASLEKLLLPFLQNQKVCRQFSMSFMMLNMVAN